MNKFSFAIVGIAILLTACGGTAALSVSSPVPSTTNIASPTATIRLSATPAAATSTATITPLPTVPALIPTLDARSIVTATPAPAAQCPEEDPSLVPDFQVPDSLSCFRNGGSSDACFPPNIDIKYLDFLNHGGSPQNLLKRYPSNGDLPYFYQDVTGDSIPELMLYDTDEFVRRPHIYYCENGQFQVYDAFTDYQAYWITFKRVQDLNADNVPEILFTLSDCSGVGCFGISALTWDGQTFRDVSPTAGTWGVREWHIQDGANGTREIVLAGDRPGRCCYDLMAPWRVKIDTYAWDGKNFSLAYEAFAPAQYRYQAIQDADREVLYGHYDKAMQLYRNAIFNDKLKWWSADQRAYLLNEHYNDLDRTYFALNLPSPNPDFTEYPRLAAYAYYRIMLLQIVEGRPADAEATYATLQQDFGDDPYGRPYAEMAKAFRDGYRSSSRMYDGCAGAISYAAQHPEILDPLYGGSTQDHHYKPEDVCPFR